MVINIAYQGTQSMYSPCTDMYMCKNAMYRGFFFNEEELYSSKIDEHAIQLKLCKYMYI